MKIEKKIKFGKILAELTIPKVNFLVDCFFEILDDEDYYSFLIGFVRELNLGDDEIVSAFLSNEPYYGTYLIYTN